MLFAVDLLALLSPPPSFSLPTYHSAWDRLGLDLQLLLYPFFAKSHG